ncbi:hypothetical protein Q3G72_034118 [Acer saccharum]|nr:hypothetical protein Q3G72_034118 [Acer saccharum]
MAGIETTTASNLECVIETTNASNLECVNDLEWKPKCDMEFDSEQSAHDFYIMYGGKMGFSIRREGFGKNRSTGELTSRKFVCSKEGFRSNDKRDILTTKPRAETRTGCNARLCSIKETGGKSKTASNPKQTTNRVNSGASVGRELDRKGEDFLLEGVMSVQEHGGLTSPGKMMQRIEENREEGSQQGNEKTNKPGILILIL